MSNKRIAGLLEITLNGKTVNAVGSFALNLGQPKRDMLVGPDRVHGHSEKPQAPSGKGEIRDGNALNITNQILNMVDATIVATVANGKKYSFSGCVYTGDGDGDTEEGKFQFEWGAVEAEEIN